jgi:hypothetical protein
MKKTRSKKSRDTVPLSLRFICKMLLYLKYSAKDIHAKSRPFVILEARIELSPTQYNLASEPSEEDDGESEEESADKSADHQPKRTKNSSTSNQNVKNKRRRNKYDKIDHFDEDWRVDADMEEFVPMTADDRKRVDNGGSDATAASGGDRRTTTAVATGGRMTTSAVFGGSGEVAIVTLPPPRRTEAVWALAGDGAAEPLLCNPGSLILFTAAAVLLTYFPII